MNFYSFLPKQYTQLLTLVVVLAIPLTQISCSGDSAQQSEQAALNDKSGIPALLEREGDLANAVEWEKTKAKVAELKDKIAANSDDVKSRLQLATIYMSEARITGNSYYNQASLKILNGVLEIDAQNFEAYTYKASIAMSLHQFEQAKQLAEKAKSINPNNAYVYGVLVDAYVELGDYEEAIAMSDQMQVMKPSLESYSRASYLREIYGDNEGAKEAMKMAVKAGAPGMESAEWARVTLGDLYRNTGDLDSAKMLYESTLSIRPEYPNAHIGLAKVAQARKDYKKAIEHTENAIRMVSEVSYVSLLGELYTLDGNEEKAKEIRQDVVTLIEEGEKEQEQAIMKHNANRELANAYLDNGNLEKALKYANADLALRPENIDANELVAWVNYMMGDYDKAAVATNKMLATNTKDADKLYKACLIYAKAGDVAKSGEYKTMAMSVNPYVNQHALLAEK